MQFGLQLASSLAPQRLAHPHACVLHLERGHVGVALCRRHSGMAKNLLHDANVHSLGWLWSPALGAWSQAGIWG